MTGNLRVVVVDDDFRVARLHAQFVQAVPGFEVVAVTHDAAATRTAVELQRPDLVLLDMFLPDQLGTDLAPMLACDVLMVTAASDAESVRRAFAAGAVNYLVKPFTPAELADRLRAYARYRNQLAGRTALQQSDIDRAASPGRCARCARATGSTRRYPRAARPRRRGWWPTACGTPTARRRPARSP